MKLPFCSKNTVDCQPQPDPQFDNSTPSLEGRSDAALSSSDSCPEQSSFTLPGEVLVEPVGASACLNLKTLSRLDDSTPNVISEDSTERLKLEASGENKTALQTEDIHVAITVKCQLFSFNSRSEISNSCY